MCFLSFRKSFVGYTNFDFERGPWSEIGSETYTVSAKDRGPLFENI